MVRNNYIQRLTTIIIVILVFSFLFIKLTWSNVLPPLEAQIEEPKGDFTIENEQEIILSTAIPTKQEDEQRSIKLTLRASGIAKVSGNNEWFFNNVEREKVYQVKGRVSIGSEGEGEWTLQAESFDVNGNRLWGKADSLFVLKSNNKVYFNRGGFEGVGPEDGQTKTLK